MYTVFFIEEYPFSVDFPRQIQQRPGGVSERAAMQDFQRNAQTLEPAFQRLEIAQPEVDLGGRFVMLEPGVGRQQVGRYHVALVAGMPQGMIVLHPQVIAYPVQLGSAHDGAPSRSMSVA